MRRSLPRLIHRLALMMQASLPLLAVLSMLAISLSCQREATPACGCEGPVYRVLTDERAVYRQGLIYPLNRALSFFSFSCHSDFMSSKVADGDTVVVSGKVRLSCFKGETLVALPGLLEVTALDKQRSQP